MTIVVLPGRMRQRKRTDWLALDEVVDGAGEPVGSADPVGVVVGAGLEEPVGVGVALGGAELVGAGLDGSVGVG